MSLNLNFQDGTWDFFQMKFSIGTMHRYKENGVWNYARHWLAASGSVALISKSGQALSLRPDLLKNTIWAQELGKLVDEVGSFNDIDAMRIMRHQLKDMSAVRQART